jgi:hypothetical protein
MAALFWDGGVHFIYPRRRPMGEPMDPFDKKPNLPVEVMITLAINVVVAILCYCAMMLWGLFGG